MTDRIIFWLSADLLPFCLAYFFQKNFDGDLFGIYDLTNKPKKFFEEQKLVKFSKSWFYHDYIKSKGKPDMEYNKKIGKKYELDLQELVNNDRILNKYNEYYKFSGGSDSSRHRPSIGHDRAHRGIALHPRGPGSRRRSPRSRRLRARRRPAGILHPAGR